MTTDDEEEFKPKINRYTFNYQIMTQSEIWAQCNDILSSCRARLFWYGDKIYIAQDREMLTTESEIELNDSNIIDISYLGENINECIYRSHFNIFRSGKSMESDIISC